MPLQASKVFKRLYWSSVHEVGPTPPPWCGVGPLASPLDIIENFKRKYGVYLPPTTTTMVERVQMEIQKSASIILPVLMWRTN